MLVAKITEEKANEIRGVEFYGSRMFNPIQDVNDNWVISLTSAQYLEVGDFEVIEFEPKPAPEES